MTCDELVIGIYETRVRKAKLSDAFRYHLDLLNGVLTRIIWVFLYVIDWCLVYDKTL